MCAISTVGGRRWETLEHPTAQSDSSPQFTCVLTVMGLLLMLLLATSYSPSEADKSEDFTICFRFKITRMTDTVLTFESRDQS